MLVTDDSEGDTRFSWMAQDNSMPSTKQPRAAGCASCEEGTPSRFTTILTSVMNNPLFSEGQTGRVLRDLLAVSNSWALLSEPRKP